MADPINGLFSCNMKPHSFKKHPDGKVTALGFRAAWFLPPSFFAVGMAVAVDTFTLRVAKHVEYPISDDVTAMTAAAYCPVPFGRNNIGQVDRFLGLPRLTSKLNRNSQRR